MKYILAPACAAVALATCPAAAKDSAPHEAGDVQLKVVATAVLPDGEIDEASVDLVGLPVGSDTTASGNCVPTIAVEYLVKAPVFRTAYSRAQGA